MDYKNVTTIKEPQNFFSKLLTGATKPFRTGLLNSPQALIDVVNELARTYGANIKDFEPQPIALTEKEAKNFYDKPGLESVKAGAGVLSYATPGTFSKFLKPTTVAGKLGTAGVRGLTEGALQGFSQSDPGQELKSTAIGAGTGVLGDMLFTSLLDPQVRNAIQGGTYEGNLNLNSAMQDKLDVLRDKAFNSAKLPKGAEEKLMSFYEKSGVDYDPFKMDIELLAKSANKSNEIRDYLLELRNSGSVNPGQLDMLLKGDYGIDLKEAASIPINKGLENIPPEPGMVGSPVGGGTRGVGQGNNFVAQGKPLSNTDSFTNMLSGSETDNSLLYNLETGIDELIKRARNYANVEDFIKSEIGNSTDNNLRMTLADIWNKSIGK